MKRQYMKPQAAVCAMQVPQTILAGSPTDSESSGPDIEDKGQGGDGSNMHAKRFTPYDDFSLLGYTPWSEMQDGQ